MVLFHVKQRVLVVRRAESIGKVFANNLEGVIRKIKLTLARERHSSSDFLKIMRKSLKDNELVKSDGVALCAIC